MKNKVAVLIGSETDRPTLEAANKYYEYFDIDFEIENKFLNILMTKSFQFGLEKIADAFQKRAESIK